jgi:hypothetical protein
VLRNVVKKTHYAKETKTALDLSALPVADFRSGTEPGSPSRRSAQPADQANEGVVGRSKLVWPNFPRKNNR